MFQYMIIYYLEVSKENQSDNTSLNDVKSNKTIYARRKLPLTKILIEKLRILDFINYRKKNKHNFIFVDEKQGKETKNLIKATIRRCESRFNDKIKKILNIPENEVPVLMITMGKNDTSSSRVRGYRKAVSEFVKFI